MLELLESENGIVQYNASPFLLATGGGGSMPDRSGPLVSIAIDQRPGWIIDLTESDGSGTVIRPSAPAPVAGPLIDVTPASADPPPKLLASAGAPDPARWLVLMHRGARPLAGDV
jgi:hypothetical protein